MKPNSRFLHSQHVIYEKNNMNLQAMLVISLLQASTRSQPLRPSNSIIRGTFWKWWTNDRSWKGLETRWVAFQRGVPLVCNPINVVGQSWLQILGVSRSFGGLIFFGPCPLTELGEFAIMCFARAATFGRSNMDRYQHMSNKQRESEKCRPIQPCFGVYTRICLDHQKYMCFPGVFIVLALKPWNIYNLEIHLRFLNPNLRGEGSKWDPKLLNMPGVRQNAPPGRLLEHQAGFAARGVRLPANFLSSLGEVLWNDHRGCGRSTAVGSKNM